MAISALEKINMLHRSNHLPNELSGGERQRVAIARAIVAEPELILADEPTGNLDSKTGEEIISLFENLHKEGKTVIIVTHESSIAEKAGRVIRLKDGMIEK
jgi:putative ABC transport system ATP-binding protein